MANTPVLEQRFAGRSSCPSRKFVHVDILDLFQERRQSEICGHRYRKRAFRLMKPIYCARLAFVSTLFRPRLALQLEIVVLRHQLTVYQRTTKCPRIDSGDRILWSWLSRRWSGWRGALIFVQTRTVLAWQHKHFRDHWTRLSKRGRFGRPPVSKEIRALIRQSHRVERSAFETNLDPLFWLLSSLAYASVTRDG